MQTLEEIRKTIATEIASDDAEVRAEFFKHFSADIDKFVGEMALAFEQLRTLDNRVQGDERLECVSALVFSAITLHLLSMKLFVSGQIVAAGNLMRQVLEAIAIALLCAGKGIGVLERFMDGTYRANNALRDLTKHTPALMIKADAVAALKEAQQFYHQYSHTSRLTIVAGVSMAEKGLYVGASFDEGKLEAYRKEIQGRVSLAEVLQGFILAIKANIGKW